MRTVRPSARSASHTRRGAVSKGCLLTLVAALVVALLFGGCGVGGYNSIVGLEENTTAKWSQVENQYKRRFDLIPQLVETVKGVADFEQETLTQITEARASVGQMKLPENFQQDPAQLEQFMAKQQSMGSALSRLLVVAENYPQLRASDSFRDLQSQLEGTENRIAVARTDYIAAVQGYNTFIRKVPNNLIASITGFEKLPQFESEPGSEEAPVINFKD